MTRTPVSSKLGLPRPFVPLSLSPPLALPSIPGPCARLWPCTPNSQWTGSSEQRHPNRRRLAPVRLAPFVFFFLQGRLAQGGRQGEEKKWNFADPKICGLCGVAAATRWHLWRTIRSGCCFLFPSGDARSTCWRDKCPCKGRCWPWGNASPAWSSCVSTALAWILESKKIGIL